MGSSGGKSAPTSENPISNVQSSVRHIFEKVSNSNVGLGLDLPNWNLNRVFAYPEKPPTIDWSYYKSKVPVAGMVDEFQKQYSAFSVPYPPNPKTAELDALDKEISSDIEKFKAESNNRIEE